MDRHTIQIQQKNSQHLPQPIHPPLGQQKKSLDDTRKHIPRIIKKLENENIDYIDKRHKKKITTYKST